MSFVTRQAALAKLTMQELLALRTAIREDPANRTPDRSIYLYTKQARRKLDDIAWAITYKLRERKGRR